MFKYLFALLVWCPTIILAQVKIYYDNQCGITMKGLGTSHRIAVVDTAKKIFTGKSIDIWDDGTINLELRYDADGVRDGEFKLFNQGGELRLVGQFAKGKKTGTWQVHDRKVKSLDFDKGRAMSHWVIDSLEACLIKKERFDLSPYVRRHDYPEILPLIALSAISVVGNEVFTIVEDPPQFPGGMQVLGQFITTLIQYPEEALKNNVKGLVVIEFTIKEDGTTMDHKVIKGIGYGCDEEAIRVIKLLPDWRPGYQRSKAVRTRYQLPISFGS